MAGFGTFIIIQDFPVDGQQGFRSFRGISSGEIEREEKGRGFRY